MKKIPLFIAIILVAVSCNKDKNSEGVSYSKLQKSISTPLGDSLRSVLISLPVETHEDWFSSLTSESCAAIWLSKFNSIQAHPWTTEQQSVIEELKSWISPEIYEEGSQKQMDFHQEKGNIQEKVLANFSVLEATLLFFQPHNYPNEYQFVYGPTVEDPDQPRQLSCHCKWDISCSLIAQGFCTNDNCSSTRTGCGFLWSFNCNERCAK
ncbi:MAG: bacteriocin fulvocin C-related protein [Schleiferiaceae bacterium]|nr:bacteriocin fulvocin C-related protein [Schleiferiaceae bacterium]